MKSAQQNDSSVGVLFHRLWLDPCEYNRSLVFLKISSQAFELYLFSISFTKFQEILHNIQVENAFNCLDLNS